MVDKPDDDSVVADVALRNLLAVIHRDGGHYIAEHGLAKAVADAMTMIPNLRAVIDEVSRVVGGLTARPSLMCACGCAARYIDADGAFVCGTCPIKAGKDSLRLADVPALLAWARAFEAAFVEHKQGGWTLNTGRMPEPADLRAIIGQRRP